MEILSVRELRKRLRKVYAESYHLAHNLPQKHPDSPHNRILTLVDIARHLELSRRWLHHQMKEEPTERCEFSCPTVNECRLRPPCRKIEPYEQKRLSQFFLSWEAGTLVKARIGDEWKITPRHTALAQMAPASIETSHAIQVDFGNVRLKL